MPQDGHPLGCARKLPKKACYFSGGPPPIQDQSMWPDTSKQEGTQTLAYQSVLVTARQPAHPLARLGPRRARTARLIPKVHGEELFGGQ